MPGRACGRTAGARMLVARVRLPGARRRGPAPPECVELSAGATRFESVRMGRVLGLIAAALALIIGGLSLAIFLTRDEDNLQSDNLLAERITREAATKDVVD